MTYCNGCSTYTAQLHWCISEWTEYYKYLLYLQLFIFAEVHKVRLSLKYRWSGTVPLNLLFLSVTCSEYPVVQNHVTYCSEYCLYANFRLDLQTCCMHRVGLPFRCKVFSKSLVWILLYDQCCSPVTTTIWNKYCSDGLHSLHPYHNIGFSWSLVYPVLP